MTEENQETPVINDPAAVLEALERAKSDAKKYREELETLKAEVAGQNVENPWKDIALKNQVAIELAKKGLKNENIAKYVNTADLELDENGKIAGLEERIAAASTEFPELFDVKRAVGGQSDSFKSTPVVENRSITDQQLDHVFGRG